MALSLSRHMTRSMALSFGVIAAHDIEIVSSEPLTLDGFHERLFTFGDDITRIDRETTDVHKSFVAIIYR